MKSHVAIGLPTYGGIDSNFYDFTIKLVDKFAEEDVGLSFLTKHGDSLITRARNALISSFYETAEKSGFTHFLFLDSDVSTDPMNIIRLVRWTEKYEIDAIGAVVPLKGFYDDLFQQCETFKLTYSGQDIMDNNEDMMKVDYLTTGMLLLTRNAVFKLIEDAIGKGEWYHNDINDLTKIYNIFQVGWVEQEIPDSGGKTFRHYLSEDWFLCRWLKAVGIDIVADLSIDVIHRGQHNYRFHNDPDYQKIKMCREFLKEKENNDNEN